MDNEQVSSVSFVQRRLPWIVAAVALLVYVVTLSREITFSGLPVMAKALGWDWQPMLMAPLLAVLTYPIRWLPEAWQGVGLNLFSAVCSALALGLLARAVALLPQDRTREQRALERSDYSFLSIRSAWVPPVIAALVLGLQLSFWEHAIVATGESLDLLVFAYCVRCLLEYRVANRESWLWRLALVYGLGITNNYALIALLPAFGLALIWIMGRDFFRVRFVVKLAGLGLAGLSLYLLVPTLSSVRGLTDYSFLELLRTHLGSQRKALWDFPRFLLVITSFTSLLPVLFIGIRWPAQYGDISAAGNALANVMMHVVHGVFLVACLWVMFDPTFSPRGLGERYGQSWAFLPLYYLAALTVGYCVGYFLLMLRPVPLKPWHRPSAMRKAAKQAAAVALWAVVIAVPAVLAYRTFPALQARVAPHLDQYGVAAAACLPPEGAVVLSDDSYRLWAVDAVLRRTGTADRHVLVNTSWLPEPAYQRQLQRQYPGRWPEVPKPLPPARQIDSPALIELLADLRQAGEVYYLHPSFGYYFERFHLQPRNLIYALEFSPTNDIANPPPSAELLAANDQFWAKFEPELGGLLHGLDRGTKLEPKMPSYAAVMAATYYSRALNTLGVEHQKAGHLEQAGEYFEAALRFNTNSAAALANQLYNTQLRAGNSRSILPHKELEQRFGVYRGDIEMVLNYNGPMDEPQLRFLMSHIFANGRNFRQAVQELQRSVALDPTFYDARVGLALAYANLGLGEKSLAEVAAIRSLPALSAAIATNELPLIQAEALAHAANRDVSRAVALLHAAQAAQPAQPGPFGTEAQIMLARNDFTNALEVFRRQMKVQTNNPSAFVQAGIVALRTDGPGTAVDYFTRALEVAPEHPVALMNRAVAYLKAENLEAALRDYQLLYTTLPKVPHWVHYGLAEVYFRQKKAAKAVEHYKEYLKLVPPEHPEAVSVKDRVKRAKRGDF